MKIKTTLTLLFSYIIVLLSCANNSSNHNHSDHLDPIPFFEKIKSTPEGIILDVRTPAEFEKGHLKGAINFDWNNETFSSKIARMDKDAPVFVYCLSGGRSSEAASHLRNDGFKWVYEMNGGIMKWKEANLPLETDVDTPVSSGMSLQEFDKIIAADKKVLVDFYAEWCAPCKRMEPYITDIANTLTHQVTVVRINVDHNPELIEALKIDALPVLHIYENKKLLWAHSGYIDKESVIEKIK